MKGEVVGDQPEKVFRLLKGVVGDRDPVPPAVLEAGRAAFGMRTLDAELAQLVYDSVQDPDLLVGVRSAEGARQLTFEARDHLLELELAPAGRTASLVGQLVPPGPARVEIRHGAGSVVVTADALGRFAAGTIPSGPLSLRVEVEGGQPVVTDWIVS